MCQIIYKPKGKSLSEVNLELIERCNPDGIGVAILRDNGVVIVDKDINNSQEIRSRYGDDELELVIHYRMATGASKINKQNSHPFSFNHDLRNKLKFETSEEVFFHNGILMEFEGNGEVDTYNFVRFGLKGNPKYEDLINYYKSYNRFVLIKEGKINLYGGFIERDGIYYANTCGVKNTIKNIRQIGGIKKWK